jgi:IclR family KDG regulon transcriptional repressor
MAKLKSDYSIQTVSNALRLLESFRGEDELGVSELSRRLDLHKNNVFRLLATLEQAGYVEQSVSSERYTLGTRCLELGRAYAHGHTLLRQARPILEALAHKLRESAHLGVVRNFEVLHLDGEQPDELVLAASRVGRRLPVHCTALGKVLLGCADEPTRVDYDRTVASAGGLTARTAATITDPHKLFEHLRSVAVQGFALDLEECEPGLCCAAAPVFDATGRALAALSISGPALRLNESALFRNVVPVLMAAAGRFSEELGCLS